MIADRHQALVVEDDHETAEELVEILRSIPAECVVVDNKADALEALEKQAFCFVLLDLQIRADRDSIKGHVTHGTSLLREIRQQHQEHSGRRYRLPILIVSGEAREVGIAVHVMKDGADDIVQKPFAGHDVCDRIRVALEQSGRGSHEACRNIVSSSAPNENIVIAIPGDRHKRRTEVIVHTTPLRLPDNALRTLLHLIVAHHEGKAVHKTELGARDDQGFKGISRLRQELVGALGQDVDILHADREGGYTFTPNVVLGTCDTAKLEAIGDHKITELARKLRSVLAKR